MSAIVRKQDSSKFKRVHFQDILNEWCEINKAYSKLVPEDALYWYNERASVGSFAVAAGRKNFHVLEEYGTQKIKKEKNKKVKFSGRCDLYLAKEEEARIYEYAFEAKQCWVSISPISSTVIARIEKSIESAKDDALKSRKEVGRRGTFALVFVVPYIPKSYCKDKKQLIDDFTIKMKNFKCDAMAYVFPEKTKTILGSGRLYPGSVCLLFSLKE